MTPENFIYWLNGFLEINNNPEQILDKDQVQIVRDHITLVLKKVTPNYNNNIFSYAKTCTCKAPAGQPHETDCPYFSYNLNSSVDYFILSSC